jgi:hypothetical protein
MSLEACFFTYVAHDKFYSGHKTAARTQRAMELYQEERSRTPKRRPLWIRNCIFVSQGPSRLTQSRERLCCIRDVPESNLDWDTAILTKVFLCFLLFLLLNTEYYLDRGFDCLLPHAFQFVTHCLWHNHQMNYKRTKNNKQYEWSLIQVQSYVLFNVMTGILVDMYKVFFRVHFHDLKLKTKRVSEMFRLNIRLADSVQNAWFQAFAAKWMTATIPIFKGALEDGNGRLFRNVTKEIPLPAA